MGFRFRKSVKIAPGIRLSASHRGLGVRMGGPGAGISFSPSGTRASAGIAGSGLSWSQKVGKSSRKPARQAAPKPASVPVTMKINIKVDEESGELSITDEHGAQLEPKIERIVKRDYREQIQEVIQKAADNVNRATESLTTLHTGTPHPDGGATEYQPFDEPEPTRPIMPAKSWLHRIWPPAENKRQEECQRLAMRYAEACRDWESAWKAHADREKRRLEIQRQVAEGTLPAMEQALGDALSALEWPYETLINYELRSPEHLVLDVDLPEIEMLPIQQASVPAKALKLSIKSLSQSNQRQQYARHIHSIGVRLLGECFKTLPTIQAITLSGYSQRLDKSSGHERDDYLYSVKVDRGSWSGLNFRELDKVDPVECLGQFEIRRQMTKTGIFRPVEPLET